MARDGRGPRVFHESGHQISTRRARWYPPLHAASGRPIIFSTRFAHLHARNPFQSLTRPVFQSPSLSSPPASRETSYPHRRRPRTSPPSPTFAISSLPSTMTKKRRSLTSILVPSFLPQASASTSALPVTSPTAGRSSISGTSASTTNLTLADASAEWLSFYSGTPSPLSPARSSTPSRNSPPPDLLDEDPFASLAPSPLRPSRAPSPARDIFSENALVPLETPLSPLSQSALAQEDGTRRARSLHGERPPRSFRNSPSTPPPSPIAPATRPRPMRRPKSSGPPQVRPAYTRPAFAPRPSLPSLNTLASTTPIHVPKVSRPSIPVLRAANAATTRDVLMR